MNRILCIFGAIVVAASLLGAPAETACAENLGVPDFDPADFVVQTDNSYFPMAPRTDIFVVEEDEGLIVDEITMTNCTVMIAGVLCTAVYDVEYLLTDDGCYILEETVDYHAWDFEGNAWYFGEHTMEYVYDEETWEYLGCSRDGTWLAEENNALPGYIMLADPEPGMSYYQEYAVDVAEDQAKVLQTNTTVTIELLGEIPNVVKTKEWSKLDRGTIEQKAFAPGKGLVLINELKGKTVRVELTESIPLDFDCAAAIDDFLTYRFGAPDCPPEPDCADLPLHMP